MMELFHSLPFPVTNAQEKVSTRTVASENGLQAFKTSILQAEELVKSEAWKRGELGSALTDTYLRIDEILVQEGNRTELQEMAGGDSDKG